MSLYSIKVRFICKFCGGEFHYVDQFIEHKILKHQIEFQQIKSIVFEENVIQNCPLPSKLSAGTGTGTGTTEPRAEAGNEGLTPASILLADENFVKRRRCDYSDSEIRNRLANIGIAVSNSNIGYNCLTNRISAEAQQPVPGPVPVVPLNHEPDKTLNEIATATAARISPPAPASISVIPDSRICYSELGATVDSGDSTDVPIKQEPQFGIDIERDDYQGNSFDHTESEPTTTCTGNQGSDDLDPLDPDQGIEHSNIKCEIEEFEFKYENPGGGSTDASSASNLRLVDDPPNFTSASASADSLSQSSHYTPDVEGPWGFVPDSGEQVSDLYPLSSFRPVPLEMPGSGPGLGASYHLQNSDAYTRTDDVNEDNRHFRFPVSHPKPQADEVMNSNFNTDSVPVQNLNENLLKTLNARNNNNKNRRELSEFHCPVDVEGSVRIRKKSLGQSGLTYGCHVPNCNSSFKSAYNLRYHIKCKHTDNSQHLKNVTCEICDKRFFSRGELNKHSVVHTDERPFQCPFEGCTSAYKRKNKLTLHLQNNHTNNRIHKFRKKILS